MTKEQIQKRNEKIKKLFDSGLTYGKIAEKMKISKVTVGKVITGKVYKNNSLKGISNKNSDDRYFYVPCGNKSALINSVLY